MTEIEINKPMVNVAELLSKHLSPRKFWLHNRVGGAGWDVRRLGNRSIVRIDDPKLLTFILLKLK